MTVLIVQFKTLTSEWAVIKSDCHRQERPSVALCHAFWRHSSELQIHMNWWMNHKLNYWAKPTSHLSLAWRPNTSEGLVRIEGRTTTANYSTDHKAQFAFRATSEGRNELFYSPAKPIDVKISTKKPNQGQGLQISNGYKTGCTLLDVTMPTCIASVKIYFLHFKITFTWHDV